jgi:hypothetical protein
MQTQLYKFSGIDPISFWKFTPGETVLMISTSIENATHAQELQNKLEARLCAVVLTANGVVKPGKKAYGIEDFMPSTKTKVKSIEDLEQMAMRSTMMMGGEVSRN